MDNKAALLIENEKLKRALQERTVEYQVADRERSRIKHELETLRVQVNELAEIVTIQRERINNHAMADYRNTRDLKLHVDTLRSTLETLTRAYKLRKYRDRVLRVLNSTRL